MDWDANIIWFDGTKHRLQHLLTSELLPRAISGLRSLGVCDADIDDYLGHYPPNASPINQNGCQWQRHYISQHNHDFTAMTRTYLKTQDSGNPG